MKYLIIFLSFKLFVSATPDHLEWENFKLEFGKRYTTREEETTRYRIWKENNKRIKLHNSNYKATYTQAENEFSDMSDEEFKFKIGQCLSLDYKNNTDKLLIEDVKYHFPGKAVPETINWVSKGFVTGVKNQGHCGSCYAFSASGALEGQWYKKTKQLHRLSEQQILDCSSAYENHGCYGGSSRRAWKYIRDAGGSNSEQSYPYEAERGRCRFNSGSVVAKVSGYKTLPAWEEGELKEAVANIGPISAAIDASRPGFRHYRSGVYYDKGCSSSLLTHAVLLVGYGSERGQDYWLVKNSWGISFGLGGYIKMARNKDNHCGIASMTSYPLV